MARIRRPGDWAAMAQVLANLRGKRDDSAPSAMGLKRARERRRCNLEAMSWRKLFLGHRPGWRPSRWARGIGDAADLFDVRALVASQPLGIVQHGPLEGPARPGHDGGARPARARQ